MSSNGNIFPTLRWRHNELDGVSDLQPHDCLLNLLFRRRSKKTSKLRVTGLCAGNSPWTGEFPAQNASNAENVSIWWRHHDKGQWRGALMVNICAVCQIALWSCTALLWLKFQNEWATEKYVMSKRISWDLSLKLRPHRPYFSAKFNELPRSFHNEFLHEWWRKVPFGLERN